jgi:hypothetical protein
LKTGVSFPGVWAVGLFPIRLTEKTSLLGFADERIEKSLSATHKQQKRVS